MSDKLKGLQTQWQTKHDEASRLIQDEKSTGEDLIRAEKLFDERDAIGQQIEEERAATQRRKSLSDRAEQGRRFAEDPEGPEGFGAPSRKSAPPAFALQGWEDAGHTRIGIDVKGDSESRRILEEVGPGAFGEATWGALSQFEYKREFFQYLKKGTRYLDRCKTLQAGLDDQGGVLAPAEMLMRVVGRQPAPTSLPGLCQQFTTGRDVLTMPRKQYSADDKYTTAFRVTWTGEIPSSSSVHNVNDTGLLGEVEIPVHTAMLSAPVTNNMLEDSAFNFQTWLESELSQVIDLTKEDMVINGSALRQPTGIANNPGGSNRPEVVLSGASAALAYDGIVDLWTALAPQYDSNAVFVMNKKSAYRALCKLKDSQNRPLFNLGAHDAGLASQRQKQLEGYPIIFSQFTADIGAANYPIIFGDLRGYYMVNRIGFSIKVLDQVQALQNAVVLLGRVRFGGAPVEHWRLKLQKSNNS